MQKVINAWILSKVTTNFSKPFLTLSPSRGRLGNQMFQMASLVGIALKYNYTPVISSECFDLSSVFDLTSLEQVSVDISNNKLFKEGDLSQYDRDITKYVDTSELIVPMNRTLDGYFQSYKHFNHSSRIVRQLLTFNKDILQETKVFLENHVASNTIKIGIHIRRGDFLSDYHRRLGRLSVDADFIHNAMEIFKQRFTDITFVVLSNDIVWCKKYITDERNKVVFSPFPSPGHDLALMSQCDHVIISVGTFGWWGGWLAGGTVVYYSGYPLPGSDIDKYFVKADYNPPEWIGIT
ncbi:glycosyltransferase 11 [Mactra antiquata]